MLVLNFLYVWLTLLYRGSFLQFFQVLVIELRSFFNPLKIICRYLLWQYPTIQIIYAPILKIWWFFILITIFMYLLLVFAYRWTAWNIPPLIPFSIIIYMSVSANTSNFTLVSFKAASHANPGAERKWRILRPYTLSQIFRKSLNTSATKNVLLWTCKLWYSLKVFTQVLCAYNLHQWYFPYLGDCKTLFFR